MRFLYFLFAAATTVNALVSDVPSLNGLVPVVPTTEGSKKRTNEFQHPGLWRSHADIETMRKNALGGVEPWATAYSRFSNDSYSLSTYKMQGPHPVINRGAISNYTSFANDARAAYQNALMWCITKGQAHWDRSTTILDAWGTDLTNIISTDRSLLVGINGVTFVNAAEIMRWEGGWVEQGASWKGGSGFSIQLYWLFARQSIIIGQANYVVASILGLLNFAVCLDDVALYNYALYAYKNDLCAGLSANFDSTTGQGAEVGRDQTHVQDGLQWLSMASRVVRNQGYDLFSLDNNLIFKASEYAARYNLNGISGKTNPACWGLTYHEAASRGLDAPWTKRAKDLYDTSVGTQTSPADFLAWADLLFAAKVKSGN